MKRIHEQALWQCRTLILAVLLALVGAPGALGQASVFDHDPEELHPLLGLPQVQKELAVTPAQRETLQAGQEQIEELEEPKDANGDPRELTEEELPAVIKKQTAIRQRLLAQVLTARQRLRLNQILAHLQGPTVLTRKSVIAALEITEEQQKAMDNARKAAVAEMAAEREKMDAANATRDRERAAGRLQSLQLGLTDRMVGVLTEAQQKKWRELIGPKFTLRMERPRSGI